MLGNDPESEAMKGQEKKCVISIKKAPNYFFKSHKRINVF